MNEGIEIKPFEWLNEMEKKTLDLCADIIRFTDSLISEFGVLSQEKLMLRDRAMKLFKLMNDMDSDYDDKYYKITEEYEFLKEWFERSKSEHSKKQDRTYIFQERIENIDKLETNIFESLSGSIKDVFVIIYTEKKERGHYYGEDQISLKVTKSKDNLEAYDLECDEVFDYVNFKEESMWVEQIKNILTDFGVKYSFYTRLHDFGGRQLDLRVTDLSQEQIRELFRKIIEFVMSHPKIKK